MNNTQYTKRSARTSFTREFFLGILVIIGFMAILVALSGCATKLDPAGVYGSQTNGMALYQADLAIVTAYNELDAFVTWEQANHSFLASNAPAAVAAANTIRAKAPEWRDTAVVLRNTYAAQPTGSNYNAMQTGLAVLQAAVSQATNYLQVVPSSK